MKFCLLRLPCQSFKSKGYVLVVFRIWCNNCRCLVQTPLAHKQRGGIYISLMPHSNNEQKLDSSDRDPSQTVRGEFLLHKVSSFCFDGKRGLLS